MDSSAFSASNAPLAWEFRAEGGDWAPIEVPAPWQKRYPDFHGRGEYRTLLKRGSRAPLALRFEAVSRSAEVFVNGSLAGKHRGAWSPFQVDLTPHLLDDLSLENEIVVRVDQEAGHDTEGFLGEIGLLFGGLWGDVTVLSGEALQHAAPAPSPPGITVEGRRILLDGKPLLLRGVLHWGYYPELGAPAPPAAQIRAEIDRLKRWGFNMVKFCLFVPPERYLDCCDEAGIWVWQEYPVWNRPLRGDGLAAELEELVERDSRHRCVIVRSFTCENHRTDPSLEARLCRHARELAPRSLVVANSSWLSTGREGDLYDEHPYLHNAEWRFYAMRMRRALGTLQPKPFLLGESMAVDTWNDLTGIEPLFAASQRALETSVDTTGVGERSLRMAAAVRKHQVETLRRDLPGTGYMITVMRDIPACPLGLHRSDGRTKFGEGVFDWHGDTMILANLDERSFEAGSGFRLRIDLSHFGPERLAGTVRVSFSGESRDFNADLDPGTTARAGEWGIRFSDVPEPAPIRLEARIEKEDGSVPASNSWNLWVIPSSSPAQGGREGGERQDEAELVRESLTPADLRALESGATFLLLAGPRKGSWRCPTYTFWSPTFWIRPGLLPAGWEQCVEELLLLDLLSGRVLEAARSSRPLVEVFDTHMVEGQVVRRPLLLETRVGRGRLLVSALRSDRPAGIALHRRLLSSGGRDLPPGFESGAGLAGDSLFPGKWKISLDGASWQPVQCGTPLENNGRNVFEGEARFEGSFVVPESWHGEEVILRCEAVGDSFTLFIDGAERGRAGPETGTWDGTRDIPREFPLRLDAGRHTLAFLVRDWRGGGGLVGPVYFTRTPDSLLY